MTFASKPSPLVALPGGRAAQKDTDRRPLDSTPFERWLMKIAGADLTLLARPECAHDRNKFITGGWLLLLVGILAGVSAAFALYRIFHNPVAALAFGGFWGFFTFTVDRLLMSSLKKKFGRLVHSLLLAIPRLLLAGMLALTVSKPLELKIFESEIDYQLATDAARDRLQHARQAMQSFPEIEQLQAERAALEKQVADARRNRDEAYNASLAEASGEGGHPKGLGPLYKAKSAFLETRAAELNAALTANKKRVEEIDKTLNDLRTTRDAAVASVERAQNRSHGILASLHALDEIASDPRYGRTLAVAIIFVNMLFWVVDITPILTKLLTPYGVYDALLESREAAAMAHCSSASNNSRKSTFTDALTQRLEDETLHVSRLDKQVLQFEEELFARALAKLRSSPDAMQSEEEIGSEVLARLRERLKPFSA